MAASPAPIRHRRARANGAPVSVGAVNVRQPFGHEHSPCNCTSGIVLGAKEVLLGNGHLRMVEASCIVRQLPRTCAACAAPLRHTDRQQE